MIHRLMRAGILVSTLGIMSAQHATAGIIGASASGPGGSVTNLAIETTVTTDDSIEFDANYTSRAPIDFFLTLNGTGSYFIGTPFGSITNSTSSSFPSFYAIAVSLPAGSLFNGASFSDGTFSNGVTFTPPFPDTTLITFNGPPGILAGDTTDLAVAFTINASGPQSVEFALTPTVIPEPSTFTLGLIGAITSLGYCARRFRRQG
jgi:hypothetical protein